MTRGILCNSAVLTIVAALSIILVLAGCRENATSAESEAVRPVLTQVVELNDGPNLVSVGIIEAQYKADLSFRVLGRLVSRSVDVGDTVEAGQTVAAIDPVALTLAVRSAAAEVVRRQAQLTNAAATEARQRSLLETNATSKATVDVAEQARAAAQASFARAQADLAKAKEQLGYAELKAEFAGVVTAVSAEVGQVVPPGQSIVTVARPDKREAAIDVSDDIAQRLKIGTTFVVHLQLDPALQATGRVREIAPQADEITRTRRVRITLENPPEAFRLGATVTTILPSGEHEDLIVPATALLVKEGKKAVWLIDPETSSVMLRTVAGAVSDDGLHITAGVRPGMRIVTAGVHSLSEGQKVRVDLGNEQ